MQRLLKLTRRAARRVRRAAIWTIRKLRRTPDPRVIEELKAQQEATAQQVIDHLAGLDAYRRALAGDDLEKQDLLTEIERQAVLTIQYKLTNAWSR